MLITSAETGRRRPRIHGRLHRRSANTQDRHQTLKAVTTPATPKTSSAASSRTCCAWGCWDYITQDGVPQRLGVRRSRSGAKRRAPPSPATDGRTGCSAFAAQRRSRRRNRAGRRSSAPRVSADRITPDWKITLGVELDHETRTVRSRRGRARRRSIGARTTSTGWSSRRSASTGRSAPRATSSRRRSTTRSWPTRAAPAVEYNFFPYSAYTRRQLRVSYAVGPRSRELLRGDAVRQARGNPPASRADHDLRAAGTLGHARGQVECSQYLHDLAILPARRPTATCRGGSPGACPCPAEISASRIRDQLSLPARGATPEEILREVRELQSGYEFQLSFGITYTFGSIFSSVVNPRFGQ